MLAVAVAPADDATDCTLICGCPQQMESVSTWSLSSFLAHITNTELSSPLILIKSCNSGSITDESPLLWHIAIPWRFFPNDWYPPTRPASPPEEWVPTIQLSVQRRVSHCHCTSVIDSWGTRAGREHWLPRLPGQHHCELVIVKGRP